MAKYEAVTADQLRARLGAGCSPMFGKDGYVIGPDLYGRICHVASCRTLAEAQRYADESNAKHGAETE